MKPDDPILDWQLNSDVPGAIDILAGTRVVDCITSASLDPIYRQLDTNIGAGWEVWAPGQVGASWELLDNDYLYHPNIGTLAPVAMAWLHSEYIVVYNYQIICIVQPDGAFTVGRIK